MCKTYVLISRITKKSLQLKEGSERVRKGGREGGREAGREGGREGGRQGWRDGERN